MEATDSLRRRCRIVAESGRDGAVTLYGVDGRTYQAIDATEAARERLDELGPGDTVMAVLEPVRCRGDGWRIVRIDGADPRGGPFDRSVSASATRPVTGPEP